jgi:predicted ribosome quality control (RQC) complex YloA/Tae2 family protein
MFFDALTLACIAGELRATVLGGRVQQALLPDDLSAGLEIYAGHQRHYVLASAHTEAGRVVLSSDKLRRGVEKEAGVLVLLRKYVRGAVLASITQPPFERILRLGFEHPEWGGSTLAIEVMGRHSNIILIGPGERVLDAVKRVGPQLSPARPILPGHAYTPPPPQDKLPPPELTEYRLQQMLAGQPSGAQVAQTLVAGLKGVSPLLAREVAFRALGDARAKVEQVTRLGPLREALAELLAPLENGQWQPTLCLEDGRPAAYAPYAITHRGEPRPAASMSEAVEEYTAAAASADPYAAAKRPVRQAIAEARARLTHRRDALARSLAEAEAAERLRERGEWILAYAHTIQPGQRELLADTGSGEPLRIPLDPDRSPSENAQACFGAYRKAQRANEGVPALLEEAELGLRDLAQLETDLDLAASRPDVEAVRAALTQAGHLRPGKSRAPGAAPGGPLSLLSPDGLPMLVGRNSRQNDEVTFRRAQGDDWWFHAHGVAGAHVIVRGASDRPELPPGTIRRAAEVAAHFSAARQEAEALVDYTRRRHVRRIPHAAPGLVTYSQEQTIRVAPRGPAEGE